MKKCDVLIRNVSVLTPQYKIVCGQYIAIRGKKIEEIGDNSACPFCADTVIPGDGKLAMPGFSRCTQCGELKAPHRVCSNCGYYKGKEVIKVED